MRRDTEVSKDVWWGAKRLFHAGQFVGALERALRNVRSAGKPISCEASLAEARKRQAWPVLWACSLLRAIRLGAKSSPVRKAQSPRDPSTPNPWRCEVV